MGSFKLIDFASFNIFCKKKITRGAADDVVLTSSAICGHRGHGEAHGGAGDASGHPRTRVGSLPMRLDAGVP